MDSQLLFTRLRDTFANLYPDVASTRRISDDAGINLGCVNFNTGARNYWHEILAEAARTHLVDQLLELVLAEYGNNQTLGTAYQAYIAAEKHLIPPPSPDLSKDEQRAYQNRQAMLKLVYDIWLKGVLERSLYNQLLIDLTMEQRFNVVESLWDVGAKVLDQVHQPLRQKTRITAIFDEVNQSLLILGGPGSGKTTVLLELAKDMIACAEVDATVSIPVVFNLSSWTEKRQSLRQWLVEELNAKYNIPKPVAQAWVDNDQLCLLLDGLDEVKQEYQDNCVTTINAYLEGCSSYVSIVVCCRSSVYEKLTKKLKLSGAVIIQPLTLDQLNEYFAKTGEDLAVIHRILQDALPYEVPQSPLELNLIRFAYQTIQATKPSQLHSLQSVDEHRKHLFDNYVQYMLQRQGTPKAYSASYTIQGLTHLAIGMEKRGKSLFMMEDMQPYWMDNAWQVWVYHVAFLIVIALGMLALDTLMGVPIYFGCGVFLRPFADNPNPLNIIMFTGVVVIFTFRFGQGQIIPAERLALPVGAWRRILWFSGMLLAVLSKIVVSVLDHLLYFVGFVPFMLHFLLFGVALLLTSLSSWETGKIRRTGLLLTSVLIWTLGMLVVPWLMTNYGASMIYGWLVVMTIILSVLLFGVLSSGIRSISDTEIQLPNQAIHQSGKNAIAATLLFSVIYSLIAWQLFEFSSWTGSSYEDATFSFLLEVIIGIGIFLQFGGAAYVKHYLLRLILSISSRIPWHYVHFLDYCADCIFLRKVGGGYIFVHRLLMEHFVSLTEEDIKRLSSSR